VNQPQPSPILPHRCSFGSGAYSFTSAALIVTHAKHYICGGGCTRPLTLHTQHSPQTLSTPQHVRICPKGASIASRHPSCLGRMPAKQTRGGQLACHSPTPYATDPTHARLSARITSPLQAVAAFRSIHSQCEACAVTFRPRRTGRDQVHPPEPSPASR